MEYWSNEVLSESLAFCNHSSTPVLHSSVILKIKHFIKLKDLSVSFTRVGITICLFDFFMAFNILTPLLTSTSLFILFTSEANM